MAKKKKSKKDLSTPFIPLFVISLLLLLCLIYVSYTTFGFTFNKGNTSQKISPNPSQIQKTTYELPQLQFDLDLPKFPSDYDSLVNSLKVSLTQHQKTTLLVYGETVSKSKHTNITDAYKELIEKEIPILIPQEYINEYLNSEIKNYSIQLTNIPKQLDEDISIQKTSFNNIYEEYIFGQNTQQPPLSEISETTFENEDVFPNISTFLIHTNSDSINEAYYKTRIINSLSININTEELITFLNNFVIYSQNPNDINTANRVRKDLRNVVFNSNLNKQGNVYWKISVIDGKEYVYPIYISQGFVVNDSNFNEPYDVQPLAQSSRSVRVPILMYHHIDQMPNSDSRFVTGLYVTPEVFEEQLAYLVKKNYKSLTSQEFYNLLKTGKNPSQKSVLITFDDATKGQYTNGYPLLKKYGLVGVFYVPSSRTSITYNQLREMARNGMIIESHSATHVDLVRENNQERLYSEIVGSRYTLRSAIGQDVITISYPGCVADKDVYAYVSQAGYLLGTSCGKSIDHYFSKRLSLPRVHVFSSLDNLKNILSGKP